VSTSMVRQMLHVGKRQVLRMGAAGCRRWAGRSAEVGEGEAGAEDGDVWAETARNGATDRVGVEYTRAARTWRLGVWGIGEGLHEQRRQGMAPFGCLPFGLYPYRLKL
jgi:hypothetical protein